MLPVLQRGLTVDSDGGITSSPGRVVDPSEVRYLSLSPYDTECIQPAPFEDMEKRPTLDQMVAAWLHSKVAKAGPHSNAPQRYERYIRTFRWECHKRGIDLDGEPYKVTLVMQDWYNQPFATM